MEAEAAATVAARSGGRTADEIYYHKRLCALVNANYKENASPRVWYRSMRADLISQYRYAVCSCQCQLQVNCFAQDSIQAEQSRYESAIGIVSKRYFFHQSKYRSRASPRVETTMERCFFHQSKYMSFACPKVEGKKHAAILFPSKQIQVTCFF